MEMRRHVRDSLDRIWSGYGEHFENALYAKVQKDLVAFGCCGMDFYHFRQKYKSAFRSVMLNLDKPDSGLWKLLPSSSPSTLNDESLSSWSEAISMDPRQWEPDKWKIESVENPEEEEMRTGMFACTNCARKGMYSKNTSDYAKQTRSADEPMTIFMHCHTCGKDYRFSS